MAGNPFRRSVMGNTRPENHDDYSYTNGTSPWTDSFGSDDASTQAPPPRKTTGKKKRVTIQTPPHSPEEAPARVPPRRLSEGRADSPPPQDFFSEVGRENVALASAPSAADEELRQAAMNTSQNSGPLSPPDSSLPSGPVAGTGGKAPYNPFARTLATTEAAYSSSKTKDTEDESEDESSRPARRPMDVDAFKNLLLTGSAVPSPPSGAAPASRPTVPRQDSFSNRGSSGQDRPADSNPAANPPQVTSPGAEYGQNHSNSYSFSPRSPSLSSENGNDSDSDSEHEYENSSLMGPEASRPQEIAPPAPPKSRVPQTVSFADFDNSVSSSSKTSTFPDVSSPSQEHNRQLGGVPPRPGLERTGSDLNKPLPRAPGANSQEKQISTPPVSSDAAPSISNEETQPQKQPQQKKGPPPPPPASRRQGQASGTPGRPRSASNNSSRKQEGEIQPLSSSVATPPVEPGNKSSAAPPPPPPSRRAQAATAPSTAPAADSDPSSDLAVPIPTPPPQPSTSTEVKPSASIPPPPPRRAISKSSSPANRTPSTASRNSIQRNEASSSVTANPGTPSGPPVPPPRRGAGKRDSALLPSHTTIPGSAYSKNARRQSSHSIGSEGSFASLPPEGNEPTPSPYTKSTDPIEEHQEKTNERDILADMSAFQAEIDALRAQGGQ